MRVTDVRAEQRADAQASERADAGGAAEEKDEFDFLGRHVVQRKDCQIEIDQHSYVKGLQRVVVPKERRAKPKAPLTPKELHDYRSIVGQLAWPARDTMPQLAYNVSDLQQKVAEAPKIAMRRVAKTKTHRANAK